MVYYFTTVIQRYLLTVFLDGMVMQGEVLVEVMEADRAQGLPEVMGKVTSIKGGEMSVYVCFVVFRSVYQYVVHTLQRYYENITPVMHWLFLAVHAI